LVSARAALDIEVTKDWPDVSAEPLCAEIHKPLPRKRGLMPRRHCRMCGPRGGLVSKYASESKFSPETKLATRIPPS
jgi:hypothetical protein